MSAINWKINAVKVISNRVDCLKVLVPGSHVSSWSKFITWLTITRNFRTYKT